MIKVAGLSKTFRVHKKAAGLKGSLRSLFVREWQQVHALKNISLQVQAGEIVGLIGANGAGKTTLVKALAGIIHPTSGEAQVLDHVPWQRKDAFRRQIALIMGQKAQLWWDLPAADGFLLLREIYQIPRLQFNATLETLTHTLQVQDKLNIQIRRLSLGERMKMELIAALLHQPKVVFLDEPTIGLDLSAQRAIREFLLKYRQEHQPAMLLTSHYMEDIEKLCERIIIIREGEMVYDGSLQKILTQYAQHKILTVTFEDHDPLNTKKPESLFPQELGMSLEQTPECLKVKVLRSKVAEAAGWLLQHYAVADLSIEEEDIGTVIEALIRKTE